MSEPDRGYGNKKRASKSKKVLKVSTIMENDSATDIVMTDANDSGVRDADHVLNQSFIGDFVDEMVVDVVNKSESVVDDIIVVNVVDGVLDKPSDKEVHHCDETEFVKHLLDDQEIKFIKMLKERDDRIFELIA